MAPKTVNIVGPNGEEADVLPASVDVWLRNGWKKGKEDAKAAPKNRGVAKPTRKPPAAPAAKKPAGRSRARHDSAETLGADGRTAKSEE